MSFFFIDPPTNPHHLSLSSLSNLTDLKIVFSVMEPIVSNMFDVVLKK